MSEIFDERYEKYLEMNDDDVAAIFRLAAR